MRPREAIIGLLLVDESTALLASEIAQRAGLAVPAVSRELHILVQAGVLLANESDGEVRYRANPADAFIGEFEAIAARSRHINDRLARALAGLARIEFAFVFGTPSPTGDIDLMVIGDIDYADIKDAIALAAADLGRPVNLRLHGRTHWKLKLFEGDKFMRRVAFGPKVFVVGTQDGLDRLGKSQKVPRQREKPATR